MNEIKFNPQQVNNIKIIVCDLDGTLFDHHKNISTDTINYLIKLQQANYILVLATGRFFYELEEYIQLLQMKKYHGYVVCCNGVEIHDLHNNTIKSFDVLDHQETAQLINLALKHKLNIRTNYENKYQMILNPWAYRLKSIIKIFTHRYPDLLLYPVDSSVPWYNLGKLCLISTPSKLKRFEHDSKIKYPNKYQYYYTSRFCIELVKSAINKYNAVKFICNQNNLTLENVLAFGDSGNDQVLLQKAKIGIVMKNGLKQLLQEATYISVKSNHHEGLLDMLQRIFDI